MKGDMDEEPKQEADDGREESKGENPLEMYMRMVLEAREKQHAQVSGLHITSSVNFCLLDLTCSNYL